MDNMTERVVETHPLKPFLPRNARMLFLGSFPPPQARWSMDFFYPNWINDFWRIMGLIHFDDKTWFEVKDEKRFDKERVVRFAEEQGLAFYDTATKVRRLRNNASDNFLEIVEPTDVMALLEEMPQCDCVVTTGGKASEELRAQLPEAAGLPPGTLLPLPAVGTGTSVKMINDRELIWWRMPSSSRAYPLALAKKAEHYRKLFPTLRHTRPMP